MNVWRAALLLALTACSTVDSQLGVPGGRTLHASTSTIDGAGIDLWRWSPRDAQARPVLVIPELGFDHRLVASLCARLRDEGFDVATLDGREVTGKTGTQHGLSGWDLDVGAAIRAHGPRPLVVAVGIGGAVAWTLGEIGAVSGIVAIDVPVRHALDNLASRSAMSLFGFAPERWIRSPYGPVLLSAGHTTPPDDLYALRHLARSVSTELSNDVAAFFASPGDPIPSVPIAVLLSPKDNLIPTEDAFTPELDRAMARRLGRLELFQRDYGHLDWLVDEAALDEIVPVIAQALRGMP